MTDQLARQCSKCRPVKVLAAGSQNSQRYKQCTFGNQCRTKLAAPIVELQQPQKDQASRQSTTSTPCAKAHCCSTSAAAN